MKTVKTQTVPAPPNLVTTLLVGFDAITNHLEVILFPILLDMFLWFGPRLRVKELINSLVSSMTSLPGANSPDMADLLRLTREFWTTIADQFNLFSALRTYPVGIPSLMAARSLGAVPVGSPPMWEIHSIWSVLGTWLLLNLVGLVLGTLFFILVVQAAIVGKVDWQQALARWPWSILQVILLALFWAGLLLALTLPLSCLLPFLMLGGATIGWLGQALYFGLVIWLLFPLLLSPFGIFLYGQKMWASVREGYRLTRLTFWNTAGLFLIILLLSKGLDLLWNMPPVSSWLAMIGILGHAFVVTGLLAALFIYYRDANRWIQRVQQQIKFMSV